MAAIAAGNVTYALQEGTQQTNHNSRYEATFSIAFGDGVLTYPAGGVPLTKANLGCPASLESLILIDPASANGFVYKYDSANEKLRIYQGDNDAVADGPLVELGGAAAPAAATLYAKVSGW
jgi:hypothetical protein